MKLLLACGLIILSIQVAKIVAENPNKIKIVTYKGIYTNKSYVDVENTKLKVIKVNETYNRVYAKVVLLKDFPRDTRTDVVVLRSRSCHGPWEKLGSYSSHICDLNDKYRKVLQGIFTAQTEGGKCVKKGKYEYYDAGSFKFHELLPEKEWYGYYLKSRSVLGTDDVKIGEDEMFYLTNELPTCPV